MFQLSLFPNCQHSTFNTNENNGIHYMGNAITTDFTQPITLTGNTFVNNQACAVFANLRNENISITLADNNAIE